MIRELVSRYEAGASSHELRAEFGLAQGSVLKILEDHGVVRQRGGLSPEQRDEAVRLYDDGLGIQRIATQLDSSYSTVRRALLEACVAMRGRLDYQKPV